MRFLHTADLHIGKRVRGFSLKEEQERALEHIVRIACEKRVDAIVVAGDIYDKPVPPTWALGALEHFLEQATDAGITVIMIAGNHDSAERLAFGARFMSAERVCIAQPFSGEPQFIDMDSATGAARFHLIPFVRPVHVRAAYPNEAESIASYTDALACAAHHQPLRSDAANVLVAHQFVVDGETKPETCESETIVVGGLDSVEARVFDAFDYVALGHIHGPQRVRRDTVRYSGSLYPYSFSEAGRQKHVDIVDIDESGNAQVTSVPLPEERTLREVRCTFEDLRAAAQTDAHADDYLHITLEDEALMDAMAKVREFYPNVMQLDFAHDAQAFTGNTQEVAHNVRKRDPLSVVSDYYEQQAGEALSEQQRELLHVIIEEARQEEEGGTQ